MCMTSLENFLSSILHYGAFFINDKVDNKIQGHNHQTAQQKGFQEPFGLLEVFGLSGLLKQKGSQRLFYIIEVHGEIEDGQRPAQQHLIGRVNAQVNSR